jgi:hypothetical protein
MERHIRPDSYKNKTPGDMPGTLFGCLEGNSMLPRLGYMSSIHPRREFSKLFSKPNSHGKIWMNNYDGTYSKEE